MEWGGDTLSSGTPLWVGSLYALMDSTPSILHHIIKTVYELLVAQVSMALLAVCKIMAKLTILIMIYNGKK